MPREEDAVLVDLAGHTLVDDDDVLPPVGGAGEAALGGAVPQALDAVEEAVPVLVPHVAPLDADVGRRAGAARSDGVDGHDVVRRGGRLVDDGHVGELLLQLFDGQRLEATEFVKGE